MAPQMLKAFCMTAIVAIAAACQTAAPDRRQRAELRPSAPGSPAALQPAPFPAWTEADLGHRLYPGDELELSVLTAPEFNRLLRVAPDGRISPPVGGAIMAGDRTIAEVETAIEAQLAAELRHPEAVLAPRAFASQRIFVGGEVEESGVYELKGEMDPLQAIMMARGFRTSGRQDQVVILRRGAAGRAFMTVVDLRQAARDPAAFAALPRLRRFDIVFVPRTRISEIELFTTQYIREALPISLGFNYTFEPNLR